MNYQALAQEYQQSVLLPWLRQDVSPLMVDYAEGALVTLMDGAQLIDMKSQSFCANLGHNHKGMKAAMAKAVQETKIFSSDTFCKERLALANNLKRIAPKSDSIELSKVFFTLGGAEANENAIKIARMYTKRHKIITRYRSYHGATLGTINFSGDYRRIPVDNAVTGVVRFPDPYPRGSGQTIDTVRLLEEIIEIEGPETIAAILLEGITGANGVFIPPKDYWSRIRQICDKYGIVLIADEVLSGFFRTGKWFAVDHFKVVPDIITISKGLTAGYAPLGALLIRKEIAHAFDHETLWCGLTQYGHSFSCATASAAISFYESENIAANVEKLASTLKDMLNEIKATNPLVAEIRSIGLLAAIDLRKSANNDDPLVPYRASKEELYPAQKLAKLLKEQGVLAMVRYSTIIIAPPLNINKNELTLGLQGVEKALAGL
jgi:taurine--2-oxoglutarate transaminase